MENGTSMALRKGASILALTLCLSVVQAKAGTAFIWAVDGTNLVGLDSTGTIIASVTAPTGDSFFSLAVAGTTLSQNIFVADSQAHALYEYNWNGTALSLNTTTFSFASDPSGGAISPQEIALDGSGNLYTTSFDGQIEEYLSTCTSPCSGTQILPAGSPLQGARGIAIVGTTAYVTVQGSYGTGYLDYFTASGTANPSITQYASLGATTTTGGFGTGQMRGVTADSSGNIYYVDNSWGGTGTNNGYICQVAAGAAAGSTCAYATAFQSGFNGADELISGQGSQGNGTGAYKANCDVLYLANYYGGTITEINLGTKLAGGSTNACGNGVSSVGFLAAGTTLPNVTGLAMAPALGQIGGNMGPANLFGPDFTAAAPEPGTWVLMFSALLSIAGAQAWRRRRTEQA